MKRAMRMTQAGPALQLGGRHIHIFRRQPDGSWKGWRLMENSADPATAAQPAQASGPALP